MAPSCAKLQLLNSFGRWLKYWPPLFLDTNCFIVDLDHNGNDITVIEWVSSIFQCQIECQNNAECIVFGFDTNSQRCVLKNQENPGYTPGITSGPKFCKEKRGINGFYLIKVFLLSKVSHFIYIT